MLSGARKRLEIALTEESSFGMVSWLGTSVCQDTHWIERFQSGMAVWTGLLLKAVLKVQDMTCATCLLKQEVCEVVASLLKCCLELLRAWTL